MTEKSQDNLGSRISIKMDDDRSINKNQAENDRKSSLINIHTVSTSKQEGPFSKFCKSCKFVCWDQLSNSHKAMGVLSAIFITLLLGYLMYSLFIHG